MSYVHYLPGGGLGDVYREGYFHNALGVLKRWKNEHPGEHLTVLLMSHNPSAGDLLQGLPWIDDVKLLQFQLEVSPEWQSCYSVYADEFANKTELRFNLVDHRSLYRADMEILRPRNGQVGKVEKISNIGSSFDMYLTDAERSLVYANERKLVIHFHAGEDLRAIPLELRQRVTDLMVSESRYFHNHVVVGANYVRPGHGTELATGTTGTALQTFSPRVLAQIIARSRGVLGTDSAPCYFASCQNVPRCLVYPPGIAFDKMMNGNLTWDWYFNMKNPANLYVKTPLEAEDITRVLAWIDARIS